MGGKYGIGLGRMGLLVGHSSDESKRPVPLHRIPDRVAVRPVTDAVRGKRRGVHRKPGTGYAGK